MNNLEINQEIIGEEIILHCIGRLDANSAGHLSDHLNRLVRDGKYYMSLDLKDIEYLSSAGIRLLVSQYKNLKVINGHLTISSMSKNVRQVLEMVGMATMLTQPVLVKEKSNTVNIPANEVHSFGYILKKLPINENGSSDLNLFGNPDRVFQSGFSERNARTCISSEHQYAIGLGAIGDSFDECKNRFGEYIMLGKNVAYLPADGSKKPDYMVSSGQLVASLTELYGFHFEGNFSLMIRFDPSGNKSTIGISQLMESIQNMTGFDQWAFVMLAESGGLIGTSLNASPVDGRKLFTFPEIKDTVNFTTEPSHIKMLTLSVGLASSGAGAYIGKFTRPLTNNSKMFGHVHTAVFPYIPLKKTDIDINETIDYLFDNLELTDILHLTNDNREIVGLGESQFAQGFCWIVPIKSVIVTSN